METFDADRLRRSLDRLDPWKRIAFMALCCERMVPNYDCFTADTGFGDSKVLRRGIDLAWSWLESGGLPDDLDELRAQVDQQAPDTEFFSSLFTSAALDAANAVASLLESVGERGGADPVAVASLARDTIDLYVQEIEKLDPNDRGFEDASRGHQLMQVELRHQRDDLANLERCLEAPNEAVRQLRPKDRNSRVGSLATSAD